MNTGDPRKHGFGIPLVLGLGTRIRDPHVGVVVWGPTMAYDVLILNLTLRVCDTSRCDTNLQGYELSFFTMLLESNRSRPDHSSSSYIWKAK